MTGRYGVAIGDPVLTQWDPWEIPGSGGSGPPPPPPPNSRVATLIGAVSSPATSCPSSIADWLSHGNPTIGPLDCNKIFYSGTQNMTTWQDGHNANDQEKNFPAGKTLMVTIKDAQIPQLRGYCESIPADRDVWICYWQEAEGSYTNHDFATFKSQFVQVSQIVKAVGNPRLLVTQDSASSAYSNPNNPPAQGSWIVDPEWVDIYTLDIYQDSGSAGYPSQGLQNYARWLNWLDVVLPKNKPLAITEYGISACAGPDARNARLQQDCAYLRTAFGGTSSAVSPFPLAMWEYWWSNCTADQFLNTCNKSHQFTDAPTIATWQNILAGNL